MHNPLRDRLTRFELIWLSVFLTVIVASTFWFSLQGTKWTDWTSIVLNWVVSPLSAVTGVVCVVLCAKGKFSNWLWGLVNSISYGLVAWTSGYYGDWILNWFYFIPTSILIFFVWKPHLVSGSTIVKMKTLGVKTLWLLLGSLAAIALFAWFLGDVDNFFTQAMKRSSAFYANLGKVTGLTVLGPLLDSASVIFQVIAEILLILMYAEQWPFWLVTNVISLFIWGTVAVTDPTSWSYAMPTIAMWLAFLVNSVYGTIRWYRSSRKAP